MRLITQGIARVAKLAYKAEMILELILSCKFRHLWLLQFFAVKGSSVVATEQDES